MAPQKETVVLERTSLTAILLADTFDDSFAPVSIEEAPVLLPLVNVPLIEYSLEWLAGNGVDEVLVFCGRQGDRIVAYLEGSKWSVESEFIKVRPVLGQNCSSVGDAMRFVDQLHVVKNDCLVLRADHVANLNLSEAMDSHLKRRKQDSSAIMTVIMTSGHDAKQRLRLGEPVSYAVVDANSRRLLKYSTHEAKAGALDCETSFLSERDSIQVRTDLLNAQMYVCAPEVLMLFSENFDYQNLSRDFIGGVLSEEELGNKIFFHDCGRDYVQRVDSWRRYDAVSRDIMGRWTYPFCPDTRIFSRALMGVTYQIGRGNQYLASGLKLPLTVQLEGNICIGPKTTIHDDCTITASVIGAQCQIDEGSTVSRSYLHNGVSIGKNVKIVGSLLCPGSVVHDHAVVEEGTVLSFGVVIGRQHTVPPFNTISLCCPPPTDRSSDENEGMDSPLGDQTQSRPEKSAATVAEALGRSATPSHVMRPAYFTDAVVGKLGAGAKWPSPRQEKLVSISQPLPEYLEELEGTEDVSDVQSAGSGDELTPDQAFAKEVAETFLRCVQQKFSQENVVLELNGLKLAELRTFVECAGYIFTTLLQMCMPPSAEIRPEFRPLFAAEALDLGQVSGQKSFLGALKKLLQHWGTILQKFLKDEEDQVELMFAFEEFFKGEGVFNVSHHWGHSLGPIVSNICSLLYNEDIIVEDAFLAWATEKENATDADDVNFYNKAKKFIEWLREAEETESETSS